MSIYTTALLTGLGFVAGSILHEATHVAVCRLLGVDASVDLLEWVVRYDRDELGFVREAAILWSPYVVGVTLLGLSLWVGWWPSGVEDAPLLLFFAGLLRPSEDDFRFEDVDTTVSLS